MVTEFNLSKKILEFKKDLNYALGKFNWGNSCLDAEAITILNEWAKRLVEIEKEFIKNIKATFDDCADKTDIWDNKRWNKFRKILRKEIDKLAGDDLI